MGDGTGQETGGAGEGAVIGIDLGGTKVRAALADAEGSILAEEVQPTAAGGAERVAEQIAGMAAVWRQEGRIGPAGLSSAGLAVAEVPDPATGFVRLAPNLPGFDSLDVAAALSRALGCGMVVENDVNAAALAEQWRGCARGVRNFAFVAFGTGLGMGLVADGRLVRGARGAAGEIAWLPLGMDPLDSSAHLHGPLETAIGSQAVVGRYRALGGEAKDVRAVFAALRGGDARAAAVIDEVARLFLHALLSIRALLDPALIVLGGAIGIQPELVQRVRALAERAGGEMPRIALSELGDRAGVVGAVRLALERKSTLA